MPEIGTATVKVVPDLSGMEPAIRAELERIAGLLADVERDELAEALRAECGDMYTDPEIVADRLLERFVIRRRPSTETESGEGVPEDG